MSATVLTLPNLPVMIRQLIAQKAERDGSNFNVSQLAKAISMPHSILVKLLHLDPDKRVHNPRIDTLVKIVDFFQQDGFKVTLDDLLSGILPETTIDVSAQPMGAFSTRQTIPVFSLAEEHIIGEVSLKLTQKTEHAMAYVTEQDIEPMFKAGSLFVVDPYYLPKAGMMLAVRGNEQGGMIVGKLDVQGVQRLLLPLAPGQPVLNLAGVEILGVVIQVNAKT